MRTGPHIRLLRLPKPLVVALAIAVGFMALYASPAWAAPFTVTKTEDTNDGSCTPADCSLREAVVAANTSSGADTITIPAGTYTLTITGANEDQAATGDLDVRDDVTINGAGSDTTTVSAGGEEGNQAPDLGDRVFNVLDNAAATMSELTVSGGSPPNDPNRDNSSIGGGISNFGVGELALSEVVVHDNTANSDGGGIYSGGDSATLTNSTVSGNTAVNSGGGIFTGAGALTLTNSTVSGNTANIFGGGIFSDKNLSGFRVTTMENSTISNNSARLGGGGVYNNDGLTTIRSTTITDNTAPRTNGAGVASTGDQFTRTVVSSSIIAANEGPEPNPATGTDVDNRGGTTNTFESEGYNVIGDGNATSAFDQTGDQTGVTDPGIGPLANNGGPTFTHALLEGSPAIDAGPPVAPDANDRKCPPPATDQRGVERPQDGDADGTARCDSGSFELEPECTITGTEGRDFLVGTSEEDVICGLGGDDVIVGLSGGDTLFGDEGNDILFGVLGGDTLEGGEGDDVLLAQDRVSGNDSVDGEDGNDFCQVDQGDTLTNCERGSPTSLSAQERQSLDVLKKLTNAKG